MIWQVLTMVAIKLFAITIVFRSKKQKMVMPLFMLIVSKILAVLEGR